MGNFYRGLLRFCIEFSPIMLQSVHINLFWDPIQIANKKQGESRVEQSRRRGGGRSSNWGREGVNSNQDGHNLSPLIGIALTDLPKNAPTLPLPASLQRTNENGHFFCLIELCKWNHLSSDDPLLNTYQFLVLGNHSSSTVQNLIKLVYDLL